MVYYFIYVIGIVKNGVKEANYEMTGPFKEKVQEKPPNLEQIKLQRQYDKGEITFDIFRTEWNKLNT